MFTAEQIQRAHAKVQSGADFPKYIQEIKALGVTAYDAYVTDGHTDYHGADALTVTIPAKYEPRVIARQLNLEKFKAELLAHQQGATDYLTFIGMCADCGIEKWKISIDEMTCIYFDVTGNEVLTENIPA